jgi:hypothetical protein
VTFESTSMGTSEFKGDLRTAEIMPRQSGATLLFVDHHLKERAACLRPERDGAQAESSPIFGSSSRVVYPEDFALSLVECLYLNAPNVLANSLLASASGRGDAFVLTICAASAQGYVI